MATPSIPAVPPTYPKPITKTLTFLAADLSDEAYLNSHDDLSADFESFARDIKIKISEIDGVKIIPSL